MREAITKVTTPASIECESWRPQWRRDPLSLTIIPTNRMTDERSSPNAHRDKESTDGGGDDRDNYNGMLLSGGVGIDGHRGR